MSVFYMVEMHYPLDDDRAAFNNFYAKHISMLLTIDGFETAQRYECQHEAEAPFLAAYRLRDEQVLERETYTARAGRNSVDPAFRAKMTNWDRNLVRGPLPDMDVAPDGWLALIDRLTPDSPALPPGFTAMEVIGLDATITERGVALGTDGDAPEIDAHTPGWAVRIFRPAHPTRRPDASGL
jgi:hypothetical protein